MFAATAVANGTGVGIVNSIGMRTEIGKIQAQIQEAAAEEDDTPLKKKIDKFGETLAKVGLRQQGLAPAGPLCICTGASTGLLLAGWQSVAGWHRHRRACL